MSFHRVVTVVIQVPLVDGKPDLRLPPGVEVVREDSFAHVSWGDGGACTLKHLGTPASGPVFCGQLTERAAQRFNHLNPGQIRLLSYFETNEPTVKAWLKQRGVVEIDGKLYPPHMIAGAAWAPDSE